MRKLTGLAKYSWVVLAYNLFVVVFGAFVRATGSGAGCVTDRSSHARPLLKL
jgi:heme A synthase